MDYTIHGILQARILEWVTFPFSRGSSGFPTQSSHIVGRLPAEPQGKPKNTGVGILSLLQSISTRNPTRVSCIAGRFFTNWAIKSAQFSLSGGQDCGENIPLPSPISPNTTLILFDGLEID